MATLPGKPRGYFEYLLVIDSETTGIAIGCDDPSYNPNTGDTYQAISWGVAVADARTLKPIEQLYVEVKWDGVSKWTREAEKVHGLSIEYLEENGVEPEVAVEQIASLILKYWGPANSIVTLGHNVATFDVWFLKRLMRSHGINLRFGNRHVDSFSLGFGSFGSFNSDDLFEQAGLPVRDTNKHNALDDALYSLESVRIAKMLFGTVLGE